ncbi:hypothetical protein D3C80_1978290 [compost metagenome]
MGKIIGLAITALAVADLHIEQVQLVIARHLLAMLVEQQATGPRLGLGLTNGRQGQGTGHYP